MISMQIGLRVCKEILCFHWWHIGNCLICLLSSSINCFQSIGITCKTSHTRVDTIREPNRYKLTYAAVLLGDESVVGLSALLLLTLAVDTAPPADVEGRISSEAAVVETLADDDAVVDDCVEVWDWETAAGFDSSLAGTVDFIIWNNRQNMIYDLCLWYET